MINHCAKDRDGRWYNGPVSKLMNELYDQVLKHNENFIDGSYWSSNSIYFARACKEIEEKKNIRSDH